MKYFAFVILTILLSACGKQKAKVKAPLFRIGNYQLSESEFKKRLLNKASNYDPIVLEKKSVVETIKNKILQEYSMEALLLGWDSKQKEPTSIEEVVTKIQNLNLSQEDQKKLVEDITFINKTKAEIAKVKLIKSLKLPYPDIDKEFAKIRKQYWESKESFRIPAEINLQQIVIPNELLAISIYKKLKDGSSSFNEIAEKFSIGPEGASNKGQLGWIKKGTLDVFDEAFQLPSLRISKPKKSSYGYHIFRVLDQRKSRKVPLDTLKAQLRNKEIQKMESRVYKKWLENELSALSVEKNQVLIDNLIILPKRDSI